MPESTTN